MKTSRRKSIAAALLALLMLVALPATAAFAGSDLRSAGTGTDDASVGTIAWTNPGNITAQDDTDATAAITALATTHYLAATDFGFSIPVDAPIVGIKATIRHRASSALDLIDSQVMLIKGGVVSGDNKADAAQWPNTYIAIDYGGSSDLWGLVWSPADINAANFGVALSVFNNDAALSRTARVDSVQISVTYGIPTTTGVSCTSPAVYGSGTTCTVTVTRTASLYTPSGSVSLTTDGSGTFSGGGVCTLSGSGVSGTCSVTYTPSGVGDGSHLITATYPGDANFLGSTGNQNLTVNLRPITVTADAKSKTYGNPDPAFTHQITSGTLATGDTITGSMTRVAGEDVGTYAIQQGTLTAGPDYNLTYVGANLTISERPITVTADAKSKTYGNPDPALTYQLTSGTLIGGDTISGALTRAAGEDFGTYAIQKGTLTAGNNYNMTYVGADLTINKRPITVTADAKIKTYGNPDPVLTYQLTSGTLVGADTFSGALTRAAGQNIGTYAIQQGTLTAGTNYNMSYVGANLTVNKRPITVTAVTDTKVYDGTTDSTAEPGITSGTLAAGDTASWTQTFNNKDVGTGKTLTPFGSVIDGNGGNNYNVTFQTNTTGEITARPITVTADDKSKTEGQADPALTYQVTSGSLAAGDSFAGALTREPGEAIGTYAIQQGTLTAGTNYNMTFVPGTFTITELNLPPTDIGLSPSTVRENRPAGSNVGTLSTTDPNAGDTFSYTFCSGPDDTSFTISGNKLKTAAKFDYETKNSYSVCVQTDDGHGGTFTKPLTVSVLNLPETFTSSGAYDGWILESSETSGAGGTKDNTATWFNLGDDPQKKQFRSILSFNTAGLPDNAVITKVTLMIRRLGTVGTNPFTTHNKLVIDIRTGPFGGANALALTDFNAPATLNGGGAVSPTQLAGNWFKGNLNNAGRAMINKTGVTQFRLRFQLDDNNDLGADYLKFYSGNALTPSDRPVLLIEYTVP